MNIIETDYDACMAACHDCVVACEVCISHMIVKNSDNDCPACCLQCVAICTVCIRALAGDWLHVDGICNLNAEVCSWCANNCRAHHNQACQACADACERCARLCHEMAT